MSQLPTQVPVDGNMGFVPLMDGPVHEAATAGGAIAELDLAGMLATLAALPDDADSLPIPLPDIGGVAPSEVATGSAEGKPPSNRPELVTAAQPIVLGPAQGPSVPATVVPVSVTAPVAGVPRTARPPMRVPSSWGTGGVIEVPAAAVQGALPSLGPVFADAGGGAPGSSRPKRSRERAELVQQARADVQDVLNTLSETPLPSRQRMNAGLSAARIPVEDGMEDFSGVLSAMIGTPLDWSQKEAELQQEFQQEWVERCQQWTAEWQSHVNQELQDQNDVWVQRLEQKQRLDRAVYAAECQRQLEAAEGQHLADRRQRGDEYASCDQAMGQLRAELQQLQFEH